MKLQNIIQLKEPSIYTFDSWKTWNTTTIMVWVHGNELSWPNAMMNILPNIEIISWKVFAIIANLKALEQNLRQTEKKYE